jgi:multidrug efflux pump subunit AcrA (membrane-fusion protein)
MDKMSTHRNVRWISTALSITAAALFLAACGAAPFLATEVEPTPLPVVTVSGVASAEGRVVPLRSAMLGYQAGGKIAEILVSEGQQVAQGEVLVQLGSREALEAALAQAQLEEMAAQEALETLNDTSALARNQAGQSLVEARRALSEAQKAFNDLDTEAFRDDLDDRRIAVQDAQDALDDAREELDKYLDLAEDNPTRENAQTAYDNAEQTYDDAVYERDTLQNQLDAAQAALDTATSNLEDTQRRYDALEDGPDPDDLALAQARLDNATAQITAAQKALDDLELTAPYAGTVVDLHELEAGESVAPGAAVVTLADFSAWMVESRDLTELDVVDVEVGQAVEVIPDALPDLVLTGEVESISRSFTERSGDILYKARIRLSESDPRLRWGMTVTLTFEP